MFDKKKIGSKIRQLRIDNNIKQDELSSKIGISKQMLSNIETGYRDVTLDVLVAISDYFFVSLDYLTGRSEDPQYEFYLRKAEATLLENMPEAFVKLFNYAKSKGLKKELITTNENCILIRWFDEWKQITLEYLDYYARLKEYNRNEDEKHINKQLEKSPLGIGLQPRYEGLWETFKKEWNVKRPKIVNVLYDDKTAEDMERDRKLGQNLQRLIGVNPTTGGNLRCTPIPNHLANYLYPITESDRNTQIKEYTQGIGD